MGWAGTELSTVLYKERGVATVLFFALSFFDSFLSGSAWGLDYLPRQV
jgi:hypothetical protein